MKLTPAQWQQILELFDENERVIRAMPTAEPMPSAKFCRESPHRTLGHLASCQVAWLPLLQALAKGDSARQAPAHPNDLYRKLRYKDALWADLMKRFIEERAEWRKALNSVDLLLEVETGTVTYNAQTLTRRLVLHEANHLRQLQG